MKLIKLLKNESGIAMPLVLIIILVLGLLGTAIWQYSLLELTTSVRDEKRARAHYLARAGAESFARSLMVDMDLLGDVLLELDTLKTAGEDEIIEFDDQNFEINRNGEETIVGELTVRLERLSADRLQIFGTGIVDGNIIQNVSLIMERSQSFNGVIYAFNSIKFDAGVEIKGDVATGGNSVMFGNNEVSTPHESLDGTFIHDNVDGIIQKNYPLPWDRTDFPGYPDTYSGDLIISDHKDYKNTPYTISNTPDQGFESIDISKHGSVFGELTIDARSGDIIVETKVFTMDTGTNLILYTSPEKKLQLVVSDNMTIRKITVLGGGIAEIFIRDGGTLNFQTPPADVDDDDGVLKVYLGDGAVMEIQAGGPNSPSLFRGIIDGPDATVRLGGNASFEGSMIVENLWGGGGGSNISAGSPQTTIMHKYGDDLDKLGSYFMVQWLR